MAKADTETHTGDETCSDGLIDCAKGSVAIWTPTYGEARGNLDRPRLGRMLDETQHELLVWLGLRCIADSKYDADPSRTLV